MRRVARGTLALTVIALAAGSPAAAQTGPTARAAGMAGSYTALARGHEALFWNPANLALDGPAWSVALPNLGATGAVVGPTFGDLPVLMDDGITAADRLDFLGKAANGLELRGDITAPIAAISIGPIAFGATTTILSNTTTSHELLALYLDTRVLGGVNTDSLATYRVGNTTFRDARFSTLYAGYGTAVGPISVGVSARYVIGHELQRARMFEPILDLANESVSVPIVAVRATSGTGFGMDVGAAMEPIPGLVVGLAVENLVQTMTWDDALELRNAEITSDELSDLDPAAILDRLEAEPLDPSAAPVRAYSVAENLFTEAYFPMRIRLGGAYSLPTGTDVAATFSTTRGKGELYSGWPSYFGVGVQQRLPVLTVRAGYATSLSGASLMTAGASLGLGPLSLSLAAGTTTGSQEAAGLEFQDQRFGERLTAASGYSVSLGLSIQP